MFKEELEIIFQDKDVVAINKPSGLLVHRTYLDPNETRFAMMILRDQIGSWVYPIHRLDKGTSGVLLFGKNQEIASALGELILNHKFKKTYLAIVRGYAPDKDTIDYPVPQGRKGERKHAVSHYETIIRTELPHKVGIFDTARYSFIKIIPETGRRHQIRRHLKHIFYPIIGDRLYGDRAHNRFYKEQLNISQMLLHAHKLEFCHPLSKKSIKLIAPLPDYWKTALENFPGHPLIDSL